METEISINHVHANSVQGAVSGGVTSRPILFSAEMVKAILEGRKTQTRRIIKPQPDDDGLWNDTDFPRSLQSNLKGWNGTVDETGESKEWKCPYGQVGDLLWVRETWRVAKCYLYKADFPQLSGGIKWKPSIFMPREACRIELRITDIRVERLQSISEGDAIAEGVESGIVRSKIFQTYLGYKNYCPQDLEDERWFRRAVYSFQSLWSKINGQKSWDENPFVWVIQFEVARSPKHHL